MFSLKEILGLYHKAKKDCHLQVLPLVEMLSYHRMFALLPWVTCASLKIK